jgi:hypothetical protein
VVVATILGTELVPLVRWCSDHRNRRIRRDNSELCIQASTRRTATEPRCSWAWRDLTRGPLLSDLVQQRDDHFIDCDHGREMHGRTTEHLFQLEHVELG